jgi:hypothetical protein
MYTLGLYGGYVMITYTDGITYIDYTYLLIFFKGLYLYLRIAILPYDPFLLPSPLSMSPPYSITILKR